MKAFENFENKRKRVWSNVFWYVKVYEFWKFFQSSIHLDKIQTLQDFRSDKIKVGKMHVFFFFRELHLITISFLIRDS